VNRSLADLVSDEFLDRVRSWGIALSAEEIRQLATALGRLPTRTELHLFDAEWSEHCSYKSSKSYLATLPTEGPQVILGPGEDAGVVRFGKAGSVEYALVIAQESHNHPSQVVPFEGAATGVGGIVRDVACMGARVVAVADSLRFGDPFGPHGPKVRYITQGVVAGVGGYGNPIGVPTVAGDVYFSRCFDDNCVVNVTCVGVVPARDVIRSRAPEAARVTPHDIVLVGKPTDPSGFGGVTFASAELDASRAHEDKAAVQVPDPFLKCVLLRAISEALARARERGVAVGLKDLGGGGLLCASSEMAAAGECGAEMELGAVPHLEGMEPFVVACSETQERFLWVVPPDFTTELLEIFNERFELPRLCREARAEVVGRTIRGTGRYVLRWKGDVVADLPVELVTGAVRCERTAQGRARPPAEEGQLELQEPLGRNLLAMLRHPNGGSRRPLFRTYDCEVQGATVVKPGEGDAAVVAPIQGAPLAFALACDGNPFYGQLDPYVGGVSAVAEAARNVAAVGAVPLALTDCLNYGTPEDPEQFWAFTEGVRGVGDAARTLGLPIVSGNVSFYNESEGGGAIDPSPIVSCLGVLEEYSGAVTAGLKTAGSSLLLVGERHGTVGGSLLLQAVGGTGGRLPAAELGKQIEAMACVAEAARRGLLLACHDLSDGGLAMGLAEMSLLSTEGHGLEAALDDAPGCHSDWRKLFCEGWGFLMEAAGSATADLVSLFADRGLDVAVIGKVGASSFTLTRRGGDVVTVERGEMYEAWSDALREALL
jgi:phosphoribosylformylglycinamidine synthase